MSFTSRVRRAMMLIVRYSFISSVLQFIVDSLLRLIAPYQKGIMSHSKHPPAEDFRLKGCRVAIK